MVKNQLFSPITTNTVVGKYSNVSVVIDDKDRPFTFKQWLYRSRAIKRGFEYEEYNNYVKSWNEKKSESSDITAKIKSDYVAFIRSLSMFFTDEEKKLFDDTYNLDEYINVEEIIPHCARKLRDIMIYYQHKRESIKRAKLKYNLVGTSTAIERMLHDYLLRAFTKHGKYIKVNEPDLYALLPELSPLNTTLEIKVEELYDDTEYMDKSPDVSATEYFGEIDEEYEDFYLENGYSKEELDWLFGNGFASVVGNNPFTEIADDSSDTIESLYAKLIAAMSGQEDKADLPISAYIDFDKTNTIEYYQKELTKKYLGESQYMTSGGYFVNKYIDLSFDIEAGNNWISFPSGEGDFERVAVDIVPIALSATTLLKNERVKGSSSYHDADKIFLSWGDHVEGAWLKDTTTDFTPSMMTCNIYANRPFTFKFPYCDYGLSGEGIEWSGPGFDNSDQTIYTLPDDERKAIMAAYWNTNGDKSCRSIALNRTTLVDCGAKAGLYYKDSTSANEGGDRISVREGTSPHDRNPNGVYTGEVSEAFLFKVASSDIPIKPGKNYISWPYQNTTIDGQADLIKGGCAETCLTADVWKKIYGSRAGYGLFDSDIIYKLDGPSGSPIECAFLSGVPFTSLSAAKKFNERDFAGWDETSWTAAATGCFQVGRYGKCEPNSYFTFIWLDEDTPIDDVVFHIEHQPDCPYLTQKKYSLFENRPDNIPEDAGFDFKEWKKCSCGAIQYSPFGHPGKKFEDFLGYADCIFADTTYPLPFDKNTWFGMDKMSNGNYRTYLDSEDFAWYQLTGNDQVEPDIGWGKGRWRCGANGTNPNKFILRKGVQYKYYRSGIGHSDSDIIDGTAAPIIITHRQSNKVLQFSTPTWMKAVMDSDGNWNETSAKSDMIIRADDTIVYDHIDREWWCITGNEQIREWDQEEEIDPYRDEDWAPFVDYNVVPVSTTIVSAKWPKVTVVGSADFPVRGEIDAVRWTIDYTRVGAGGLVTRVCSVDEPLYFTSVKTGYIAITAEGFSNKEMSGEGEEMTLHFDETYKKVSGAEAHFKIKFEEPEIIHTTSASVDTYTVTANTIGFPLNIRLSGWDYDKSTFSTYEEDGYNTPASAEGARPVWVKASNKSDNITHQKATTKWGGGIRFVEDYIPIMQPEISDIVLSAYSPVSYETTKPIEWKQPIELEVPEVDRRWCKLEIDDTKVHNLSDELAKKDFRDLIAKPSEETSEMVLNAIVDGEPVTINYWANNSFTWEERIQDVSKGVAPTGGDYVNFEYVPYVSASRPWANLSSRHYPTIAVAPVANGFYKKEDVGGYVIPQLLGATVALGKNVRMKVDTENRTSANDGSIMTDIEVYAQDNGLSLVENNKNVVIEQYDPMWMKSAMVNGQNAGYIKGSNVNQQFMSYQTTTESRNLNNLGLMRNGDLCDPWRGDDDLEWISDRYDMHFTKQLPIAAVRKTYIKTDLIKEWTSDIYGYSYGIEKSNNPPSEYVSEMNKYRYSYGDVYIRRNDGDMSKLSEFLTCLNVKDTNGVDYFPQAYSIAVYYDVLVMFCKDRLIFYKLIYNENETERGYRIINNISCARIIKYKDFEKYITDDHDNNWEVRCAGCWKFPDKDKIDTIFLLRYKSGEPPQNDDPDTRSDYYTYIHDTMSTTSFEFKQKQIREEDEENPGRGSYVFRLEDIDPDYKEPEDPPPDYTGRGARFRIGDNYTLVGPFMDYCEHVFSVGFQIRCDSGEENIGRFVRTQINDLRLESKNFMVKKLEFEMNPS